MRLLQREPVRHDKSLALNTVPVPQEEAAGLIGNCYSGSAGEVTYEVGRDSRLTSGICDVVSDVDGDGSEDVSSDGSGSDSSDSSLDGGGGVRFRDLGDLSASDSDDEEWEQSARDAVDCEDGDEMLPADDRSCFFAGGPARRSERNPSWRQAGGGSTDPEFSFRFVTPSACAESPPTAEPDTSRSSGLGSEGGMSSRTSGSGGRVQQEKPRPKTRAAPRSKEPQRVQRKQDTKEKREEAQKRRKRDNLENRNRCPNGV